MSNTKSTKITVSVLAKEAGVSPATVSRVMNRRYDLVTQEKVDSVFAAMNRLGLEMLPDPPAAPKDKPVILFTSPDNNPFYAGVLQGSIASANAHSCTVLSYQCPLDSVKIDEFLQTIRQVHASGVILLHQVSTNLLDRIGALVPLIQCCEYNVSSTYPYVSIDDVRAARSATEYLISRGRNKIAFINGPDSYRYAVDRKRGFQDAMEAAKLYVPRSWIVNLPEINFGMAYSVICQILSSEPKPNAFFAASDILAAAALKAVRHFQYRVPQDIMIMGFDNIDISQMCSPAITTVDQPQFQQGFTACELLIRKIHSPEDEIQSILLETELVIRETA